MVMIWMYVNSCDNVLITFVWDLDIFYDVLIVCPYIYIKQKYLDILSIFCFKCFIISYQAVPSSHNYY